MSENWDKTVILPLHQEKSISQFWPVSRLFSIGSWQPSPQSRPASTLRGDGLPRPPPAEKFFGVTSPCALFLRYFAGTLLAGAGQRGQAGDGGAGGAGGAVLPAR